MKRKKVLIGGAILLIVLAAALSAAVVLATQNKSNNGDNSDDLTNLTVHQYVFLEHQTRTEASLNGDNSSNSPAYLYLGYPIYNASQLQDLYKTAALPRVNESLQTIFQEGSLIGPSGCHGAQLKIDGIYRFPFVSDGEVEVLDIDGDGVAYIIYDNQPIILKPGQAWYNNESFSDNVQSLTAPSETVVINVTVVDGIRNYGIYKK
jgi:hypothetical protein